jgi:DnaJ-class molecular chaperone
MSQGFFRMNQTCSDFIDVETKIENPCPNWRPICQKMKQCTSKDKNQRWKESNGDWYIAILVKENKLFQNHEDNLCCTQKILFSPSAREGEIETETIHG